MWRYTRALDTRNADAYVAAYTPDGQFSAGSNVTKGRAALHKMIANLKASYDAGVAKGEPQAPMYRATLNHYVEFVDKDHARIHAYYLTAFGPAGQKVPLRVAAVGRSVDNLVPRERPVADPEPRRLAARLTRRRGGERRLAALVQRARRGDHCCSNARTAARSSLMCAARTTVMVAVSGWIHDGDTTPAAT